MIVPVQKRYCYKQNRYGGLGEALAAVGKLQENHPDEAIVLEFNERSHSTKYRVVRIRETEVEVPDPPQEERPEAPKAQALPNDEVEIRQESRPIKDWLDRVTQIPYVIATHLPTGISVERRYYSERHARGIRSELEERVDPTFSERLAAHRKEVARIVQLEHEWRERVARDIKDAGTLA